MSAAQPSLTPQSRRRNLGSWWLILVIGAGACFWGWHFYQTHIRAAAHTPDSSSHLPGVKFEAPETLVIPAEVVQSMALAAIPARTSSESTELRLTGRLMYDPNELVHVNTRFAGEVIRVGELEPGGRPLRVGDAVQRGQLLAIVWSKEIGEKKSDLVDALSQLALHEIIYKSLKSLEKTGAVPQRTIDEMERMYESDLIQVERYRRTLRSWKIDDEELKEVEEEAKKFHAHVMKSDGDLQKPQPPSKTDQTWAEIDIKSPLEGIILEKNLTIGDIVDTNDDLFKVADLRKLVVMANLFEDDLPDVLSLPAEKRVWKIRLTTNPQAPPIEGPIEMIGNVIDPNQHTAVVQGWVDNSQGKLRVGQFVEATIALPPQAEQIEIPLAGLIDDGPRKYVLVAHNDQLTQLERREVKVDRQTLKSAFVHGASPQTIQAGERILVKGVLELAGVLEKLKPITPSGNTTTP